MGNKSESGREGLYRLRTLANKLRRAVVGGKDLHKGKYQRYYQKCITLRDDLEKEALEALDSGEASHFDEIAESVHAAAEIVEQFKLKLGRINEARESNNNTLGNSGQKTEEIERWASFSDHDKDWNRSNRVTDNVKVGRIEFKLEDPRRTDGRQYLDLGQVGREVTNERRYINDKNVGKFLKDSGALPKTSSISTSISLHASAGRNNIDRYDHESDDSRRVRQAPKVYATKSQKATTRNKKEKDVQNSYPRDTNQITDTNHIHRKQKDEELNTQNRGKNTYNGLTGNASVLKHRSHKIEGLNRLDVIRHYPNVDDEKRKRVTMDVEGEMDLALYMTYTEILEKCLMITDSDKLGPMLLGKTLQEKVLACTKFVDTHNHEYDVELSYKATKKATKGENDVAAKVANLKVRTQPIAESTPEPLWRVKEDGGVSEYIGRYLAKGGTLFDGILFTVNLSMASIQGSSEVEVQVEVMRKMHNVEIITGLCGDGTETVRVIYRSETAFTFRCDPDAWTYSLPSLVVEIVESDGTKRDFNIKAPIGPSTLLQPLELSQEKINRIMKNNSDVGFYTMHKAFAPKKKLEMSTLLASLSKHFSVNKTNTKHTLAAVDIHEQIIVATLHNEGNVIVIQLWSPSEKLITSACGHVKEVAAYLATETNRKLADMSMRSCNVFPLEFEKDTPAAHTNAVSELPSTSSSSHVTKSNNNTSNATVTRHAQGFSGT